MLKTAAICFYFAQQAELFI